MPATTGTFSATGVSVTKAAQSMGEMAFSATGPFVATVVLERANSGHDSAWLPAAGPFTAPFSGSIPCVPGNLFRLRCTKRTSGTVTYSFQPPGPFAPTLGVLPISSDGLPPNSLWNNAGVVNVT